MYRAFFAHISEIYFYFIRETPTMAVLLSDERLWFTPAPAEINQIIVYGQSLAAGATSRPLLPDEPSASNLTYRGGVRGGAKDAQDFSAAKPLAEDEHNPAPDGLDNRGETVCSGAAAYATRLAQTENGIAPSSHVLFISSAGKSGAAIGELQKESPWYRDQFLRHLNGTSAFSRRRALQAIFWLQGETNSDGREEDSSVAGYKAALLRLRADIEAQARSATGQRAPVPFIVYQHATNIRTNPDIALAYFDLIREAGSPFFFAAPTYLFPHAEDGLHLTAAGYRWLGYYFGRAYKQMMHDGIRPRAIMPLDARSMGREVRVRFRVPQPPLVLDVAALAATADYGFSVYDRGERIALRAVRIEEGDTVVLEAERPLSAAVTVKYAMDALGKGLNIQAGASGNLRDSTAETVEIDGKARPLFYLCPHFSIDA